MVSRAHVNARHWRAMEAIERGMPASGAALEDLITWGYVVSFNQTDFELTDKGKQALRTWREMETER